jgi:uncharacterized protein YfaS (alpha-2-macroglobulin family)
VRLEVAPAPWFELLDPPRQELVIGAHDVDVVPFRIRVLAVGQHELRVTALGTTQSDAIVRKIRVEPDGKRIRDTWSGWLQDGEERVVALPAGALPGTSRIEVKIYPGPASQAVEGLEAILRMPYGCFEQSTSATYPDVMVLTYLKEMGTISPELQMQAEAYVAHGYQRLLTYQAAGGGFSLFGRAPADPMLSAYGLMLLSDMRGVYPVDEAVIERSATWLLGQQAPDGSWPGSEDRLAGTAFVVWALAEAGYADAPGTQEGVKYLREHLIEHLFEVEDPYWLALCANALVRVAPYSGSTTTALDQLAEAAVHENDAIYWQTGARTLMGGRGPSGTLETTALAAQALLRAGQYPRLAEGAVTYLIQHKDSFGTWGTTQATVWSLEALLLSATQGAKATPDAAVTVAVDGELAEPLVLHAGNRDVVQVRTFDGLGSAEHRVAFQVKGEGRLLYQITAEYYLPWELVPAEPREGEAVRIDVHYDRTALAVDDLVTAHVTLELRAPGSAQMMLLDLGVPPGFELLTEDLEALVAGGVIERFDLAGRQLVVYLTDVDSGQPVRFQYRLRAKTPLRVKTPLSEAYDYYNPELRAEEPPIEITVGGGET